MNVTITDGTRTPVTVQTGSPVVVQPATGPVTSVNGETGAVTVTAAGISADPAGAADAAEAAAIATAAADATVKVAAHTAATDPHGDRAYATATFLPLAGGTVTGNLAVSGTLTARGVTDWFNVKKYLATGDGTTDDTTAIAAAITACQTAGGGVVFFPAGTYLVAPDTLSVSGNGVRLVGASAKASILKKASAGVMLSISGPSTDATGATHRKYCTVESLGFNGNSLAGNMIRLYYADNILLRDLYLTSNADVMVDTAELWDSRLHDLSLETCGASADSVTPMVYLRNSAATSGFGYSADSTNQIHITNCRFEDFNNGALRIGQGTNNTNVPNGIYVTDNKMETAALRGGSHLNVADACRGIYVNGLYCYAGAFYSGYSTAQNIINWAAQASSLENVLIANGGTATVNAGVDLYSGASSTAYLRTVIGIYGTAPTGAHIYFESSSADFDIQNCYGSAGAQTAGTVPIRWAGQSPIKQVAGTPGDASFTYAPMNGTFALDTTNSRLYVRLGGAWVYVPVSAADFTTVGNVIISTVGKGLQVKEGSNAKMGTATLNGTTAVTVSTTAVTANSRILLTINTPGGTPASPYVFTRTGGTSFQIKSTGASDTSTVAWMLVEPA